MGLQGWSTLSPRGSEEIFHSSCKHTAKKVVAPSQYEGRCGPEPPLPRERQPTRELLRPLKRTGARTRRRDELFAASLRRRRQWKTEKPSCFASGAIVGFARRSLWREAAAELFQAQRVAAPLSVAAFAAALSSCSKAKLWAQSLSIFEGVLLSGIEPDLTLWNTFVTAHGRGALWQHAVRLVIARPGGNACGAFHGAQDLVPDIVTYSAAVDACARGGEWRHAQALLRLATRAAVRVDAVASGAAVAAAASAGGGEGSCWGRVMDLIAGFQCHGVEPSVVTCNTAIAACDSLQAWFWSIALLEIMKPRADVVAYNSGISTLTRVWRWEKALALLASTFMLHVLPDVVSRNAAVDACTKGLQWRLAVRILRSVQGSLARGLQLSLTICGAAISACGGALQWEEAASLVDYMVTWTVPPDAVALSAAVVACGRSNAWHAALGRFPLAHRLGVSRGAASAGRGSAAALSVAAACAAGGQSKHATALLDAAFKCRGVTRWGETSGLPSRDISTRQVQAASEDLEGWAVAAAAIAERLGEWARCLRLLQVAVQHWRIAEAAAMAIRRSVVRACGLALCWEVAVCVLDAGMRHGTLVGRLARPSSSDPEATVWSAATWVCEAANARNPVLESSDCGGKLRAGRRK
mmetsp:Transcript_44081/g.122044  ORF Transcript_44081/g.122044 Transcript_44081/m.122044 type:complete len:640 (-) Transcript_44081:45-1964(-)